MKGIHESGHDSRLYAYFLLGKVRMDRLLYRYISQKQSYREYPWHVGTTGLY